MTLEEMKNVDPHTEDMDSLVDINDVHIDESLPKEERMKEFNKQIKNPYCYRIGDMVVKNDYSNDGVSLREDFEQYIQTL